MACTRLLRSAFAFRTKVWRAVCAWRGGVALSSHMAATWFQQRAVCLQPISGATPSVAALVGSMRLGMTLRVVGNFEGRGVATGTDGNLACSSHGSQLVRLPELCQLQVGAEAGSVSARGTTIRLMEARAQP